jgi:hypothetical protein
MRDWEEESVAKKQANEENRARLDDMRHRRPSTPPREPYRRNSSEARRFDEQRRVEEQRRAEDMRRAEEQRHGNDGYHPSEAAHHSQNHQMPPAHLPPMQQGPTPMQGIIHEAQGQQPAGPAALKEYPAEDRKAMEHAGPGNRGPQPPPPPPPAPAAINEPERAARKVDVNENYDDDEEEEKKGGIVGANNAGASGETKITTPTSGGPNGVLSGSAPKVEAA